MAPAITTQPEASMVRSAPPPAGAATIVLVLDPEVALADAAVDGIDDVAAGNFRQHGSAASAARWSAIGAKHGCGGRQFARPPLPRRPLSVPVRLE